MVFDNRLFTEDLSHESFLVKSQLSIKEIPFWHMYESRKIVKALWVQTAFSDVNINPGSIPAPRSDGGKLRGFLC